MKKGLRLYHLFIFLFVTVVLVFIGTMLVFPSLQPQAGTANSDPNLEVGSTTGITILAFLIAFAILFPLLRNGIFRQAKNSPENKKETPKNRS